MNKEEAMKNSNSALIVDVEKSTGKESLGMTSLTMKVYSWS